MIYIDDVFVIVDLCDEIDIVFFLEVVDELLVYDVEDKYVDVGDLLCCFVVEEGFC